MVMGRKKRMAWNKVTSTLLLKIDPFYNNKINDSEEFVPSEKTFFNNMYADLCSDAISTDKQIQNKIKERTRNLVICIKGYAGCGKSVYVQKVFYDRYPKLRSFRENTYSLKLHSLHRLEIGVGTSEDDIASRYRDGLSVIITEGICSNPDVYDVFCKIVFDNSDAIKYIDNSYLIHDSFITSSSINSCIEKIKREELCSEQLRNAVRLEIKKYTIPNLLALDCLWRISIHANAYMSGKRKSQYSDSMFFICFDNLDAIDNIDLCRNFISQLCEFRSNLDACLFELNRHHKEYNVKTFVFFVTCRSVTWGRLNLSEYAEDDDSGDISSHLCDFDISNFYSYTDIIQHRLDYYDRLAGNDYIATRLVDEIKLIHKLNGMNYIRERFKPLFNYNYRKCVDVISYILQNNKTMLEEAIQLARHDYYSPDDDVYSGSSSMFFRLVFDYFQKSLLFEKMDLIDVDTPYEDSLENRTLTSQSRIILTYLYNEASRSGRGKTRLDQLFDYFSGIYSANDICEIIYNLFLRNSCWRRPINFSKRPLKEHYEKEDLYTQLEYYNSGIRTASNFTKFEICKAGQEFVEFVAAHFEFFACRCSLENQYYPPLFSQKSMEYNETLDRYMFERTCEAVIEALKNCCRKLNDFNRNVMDAKSIDLNSYLNEPINKKTEKTGAPQLHEERLIFCHIFHIEAYRHYIINQYMEKAAIDKKRDINRRLVSIVEKYLILHDEVMSRQRQKVASVMRSKIGIIKEKEYLDFDTKIEYNRPKINIHRNSST